MSEKGREAVLEKQRNTGMMRCFLFVSVKKHQIIWIYLVTVVLSGLLMSDYSLKLTNNADWKVPPRSKYSIVVLECFIWDSFNL